MNESFSDFYAGIKSDPVILKKIIEEIGKQIISIIFRGIGIVITPIILIIFAELFIYFGMLSLCVCVYDFLLIDLTLSQIWVKNKKYLKARQALMLLPILRLLNLSMPVFYEETLYSFIFIYTPLIIPIIIVAIQQRFTIEEIGLTFKKIGYYFPLSVITGAILGASEYNIIKTGYLIPDISFLNLIKLTFVMVFFVGLIEELIFRSIIQERLGQVFGVYNGLLISSILFGMMHSGYGTPYEIMYTTFVGATLGIIFQQTKSLPLITLTHGFVNVFLFGIYPHINAGF